MYDIPENYRERSDMLAGAGDEEGLEDAINEAFSELMQDQAQGAEVAAKIISEAEALNAAAKFEMERIKALSDKRKARIDRAKASVLSSMLATNTKSIESSIAVFSVMNGRESTKVHDHEALELLAMEDIEVSDAIKVEVVKKPVLKEIKALIVAGKIPEEIASQVRGDKTLKIK
jgi:hypothetical protein